MKISNYETNKPHLLAMFNNSFYKLFIYEQRSIMKQKLLSVILLCMLFIGIANAQQRQVSGKVTSASEGSPLAGVSVRVDGTNTATQTDGNGDYSIAVSKENAVLVFSYIGYSSQRVNLGNQSTVNIQLTSTDNELEEVIEVYEEIQKEKLQ